MGKAVQRQRREQAKWVYNGCRFRGQKGNSDEIQFATDEACGMYETLMDANFWHTLDAMRESKCAAARK